MSEENEYLINKLFNKDWEIKETSSGYKTECPCCGLQGGRTQGFIIDPITNTWYCHSSGKHGGMLELVAILNKFILCNDCNDTGEKKNVLEGHLFKETLHALKTNYDEELYNRVCSFLNIKNNTPKQYINTDEEEFINEDDITISKENVDFKFITILIEDDVQHLDGFELMDLDLGLIGESYKALEKNLYYYQNSLRQKPISYKINYRTCVDNRPHLLIIAEAGAGKTTIVKHLLESGLDLAFSVSATTRPPRGKEIDGEDYFFLTVAEFKKKIKNNEFVEYEEVYKDLLYGTMKSELDRIWAEGKHVLFDVDVVGGLNLKKQFGTKSVAIFIMPPSVEELENRLIKRATDSPEKVSMRVEKAREELKQANQFDTVIINHHLDTAKKEALKIVTSFLER